MLSLRRLFPDSFGSDGQPADLLPQFPSLNGTACPKEAAVGTIVKAAEYLNTPAVDSHGRERISGHSLGGALATLSFLELSLQGA